MLLPDGYWSPEQANGGIGVPLIEHKRPQTWGCMMPDHLAAQLLLSSEGVSTKVQRNTQAELLAVLTTILTWRNLLEGTSSAKSHTRRYFYPNVSWRVCGSFKNYKGVEVVRRKERRIFQGKKRPFRPRGPTGVRVAGGSVSLAPRRWARDGGSLGSTPSRLPSHAGAPLVKNGPPQAQREKLTMK